jgi:SNW domain-containing protein 1
LPAKNISGGKVQFDQRLLNTTKGIDSGYADEESYNVYDKPWREGGSLGAHIYRPSRNLDKDVYGDDLEKLIKTNRYFSCSFTVGVWKLLRQSWATYF